MLQTLHLEHNKPRRGRRFSVDFIGMMVLYWIYLRHYITMEFLGAVCYDRDKSTVSRHISLIRKALENLKLPQINREHGLNEKEILYLIRDVTESKCPRSGDYETQKKYYSGKKKTHTQKTEAVIDQGKIVRSISTTQAGSTHDITIAKTNKLSGGLENIPQKVDKGYAGLQKEYPPQLIEMPQKKSRKCPLTFSEKLRNKMIGQDRVKVENVFAECKVFQCLAQRRRRLNNVQYQQDISLILGVLNMRRA